MPVVMKIMSAPCSASRMRSVSSSAACLPTSGLAPAPEALVSLPPICSWSGASAAPHGLDIGVGDEELDALDAGLNHPVDGVPTTPAHPDDFDLGGELVGLIERHGQPVVARLLVKCDH